MFHSDTHIDLRQPGPAPDFPATSIITSTQVLAALAVSMGSMIVGFCSAWSSPAIASLMEPGSRLEISPEEASWIGSMLPLAALGGGFVGGPLLEALGRKRTIQATAIPFMAAGLLVTYAQDAYTIYAGRGVTGFCIGIISLSLPVYLAEAIHPEVRGTLGLLPTSLGNAGVMLSYILGFWLDWSHLSLAGAVLPLPFLILVCMIPETPRYLISQDQPGEARASLQWLRGPNADIVEELADMETATLYARKHRLKAKELFSMSYFKPLAVSLGLMFAQQFSGINAVMFYSVSIFKEAGSSINSNLATIILGIVNIMATVFSNVLIDRLGRKILLYISTIGMIVSLGMFGAYFYLKDVETIEAPGWIPLIALMMYVISFSVGFGPIPWLMMGEIFPSRIRGAAASISTAFNWSCTFVVTKTFMDLKETIQTFGVFWLFSAVLFVAIFFIIFFVPETQGKSLEEIEQLYTGKVLQPSDIMPSNTHRVSSIANLKATPSQIL